MARFASCCPAEKLIPFFVLEGVADESEILAEKHVVDYDDTAEHPCRLFDIAPRALVSQRIEYPEPYDEGSHRKAAGGYEVPYGIAHIAGNYEFLRGCRNDRRGDDKSGQHGKENRAAEEHLRMIDVLVRLFFTAFAFERRSAVSRGSCRSTPATQKNISHFADLSAPAVSPSTTAPTPTRDDRTFSTLRG